MMRGIILQRLERFINFREKFVGVVAFLNNIKKEFKPMFIRSVVIYMAVKIGTILSATLFASIFLINSAIHGLITEITRTGVILFISFLGMIVALKVYFVIYILATHNRSRVIITSLIGKLSLNARRSLYKIKETVHTGLPSFSPEKFKIHL